MASANTSDLAILANELQILRDNLQKVQINLAENNNAFFMLSMALIIFLMQCGFAFLEAGAVRSKNCTNIIMKNVLDSLLGIIGYWSIGWALSYGANTNSELNRFFGFSEFFLSGTTDFSKFFFQFVFAATAATIISGAVAERCHFICFLSYSIIITSLTYPILTHWGWNSNGWMAMGFGIGNIQTTYIDFAGSGLVHVCGGTISLIAAYIIEPRTGRFIKRNDGSYECVEIKGHSVPFAALGGFILMFGFLAFNGGSTSDISTQGVGQIVARSMINTILCGAFAALTYLLIHYIRMGKLSMLLTINACLTGMVSACAGCNQMPSWACIFVGSIAALIYLGLSNLCIKMRIDDPLDAFAVHFGGGFWGLLSVCLFAQEKGLVFAIIGTETSIGQALAQIAWQIICAGAIILWSTITLAPVLYSLKRFNILRVPLEVEIKGLDIFLHGEASYPLSAYGHGWEEILLNDDEKHYHYNTPQNYEHPEHHHLGKNMNMNNNYSTNNNNQPFKRNKIGLKNNHSSMIANP